MCLFLLRACRLLVICTLGVKQYLCRRRVQVCAIIIVIIVGATSIVVLFFYSFPLGENDRTFFDSLPVETTGVKSQPCDFKNFWLYLSKLSAAIFFGTHLQSRHYFAIHYSILACWCVWPGVFTEERLVSRLHATKDTRLYLYQWASELP